MGALGRAHVGLKTVETVDYRGVSSGEVIEYLSVTGNEMKWATEVYEWT